MTIFISILLVLMAIFIYKRYFPVMGIPLINQINLKSDDLKIVDLRDFNISYSTPVKGSINIPIAYLNRNIDHIPNDGEIHVIASSPLERNLGIRLLRKKGFRVVGYSIYDANGSYKINNCA